MRTTNHPLLGTAVLLAGLVVVLGPAGEVLGAADGQELRDGLVGLVILFAPYVVLAVVAARARAGIGLFVLALLAAATFFGGLVAETDAQGGLVFLYILPLQLVLAGAPAHPRLRRRG